jgi:hypothetical protein
MSTAAPSSRQAPVDRRAVVRRHNVRLAVADPMTPVTVGNGEFAFSADVTGLQTFPAFHEPGIPLCTQSQWGWHSFPLPPDLVGRTLRLSEYDTHGRPVGYATDARGQEPLFNYLRESPHRLHLGRIGFVLRRAGGGGGEATSPADLGATAQDLDLWSGVVTSRFTFEGEPVEVETCCAGALDAVAVRVRSTLVAQQRVAVRFAFPYGSPLPAAADWNRPDAHTTAVTPKGAPRGKSRVELLRTLDGDQYHVTLQWCTPAGFRETGPHEYELAASPGAGELAFVCAFTRGPSNGLPDFAGARAASAAMWADFWEGGGAVDFDGSTDPRAEELERRTVLSQYLMRANCAGSLPPAETGLTCNSWYGKFHLEMHWWHGVHWALWGRLPLLERSLAYYDRVLPEARRLAIRQGYGGARWPKMVGPDGVDSPSPVGPLLLWQQPHPIYYAELCYRERPTRDTLVRWRTIVEETAEFMASFAVHTPAGYVLGPPAKTVPESTEARTTCNPAFELSQWRFGLRVANQWYERLGLPRRPNWDRVLERLSPLPQAEGCYLFQDGATDTYTEWNWEHPSIAGVRGVLPGDGADGAVHRRTVERVMAGWQWDRCWGWDFPMTAMAAARAGRPDLAVDALFLASKKNTYSKVGHNYQRPGLHLYLPGNGGLLSAVAMMAAGWDGCGDATPGFPLNGWRVRHEGLRAMMAV